MSVIWRRELADRHALFRAGLLLRERPAADFDAAQRHRLPVLTGALAAAFSTPRMARHSVVLFFQGKLFAEPAKVYRQWAIGVVVTAVLFVAATKLAVPVWLAGLIAGLLGGVLQPYLFKDLRYR